MQINNLFPDHFIACLSSPTNYIGSKQLFETVAKPENLRNAKLPLVKVVHDDMEQFPARVTKAPINGAVIGVMNIGSREEWDEEFGPFGAYLDFEDFDDYWKATRASRPDDPFPNALPDSLKEAILAFVLSTAIRESRDERMRESALYQPHNTMLIHTSRFKRWQNKTKELVSEYFEETRDRIINESPMGEGTIYAELKRVWLKHHDKLVGKLESYLTDKYVDAYLTNIVFDSVIKYVPEIIGDFSVKALNTDTHDSLNYESHSPQKVIAIGGNRLSRGFTLEGLTVNYFCDY